MQQERRSAWSLQVSASREDNQPIQASMGVRGCVFKQEPVAEISCKAGNAEGCTASGSFGNEMQDFRSLHAAFIGHAQSSKIPAVDQKPLSRRVKQKFIHHSPASLGKAEGSPALNSSSPTAESKVLTVGAVQTNAGTSDLREVTGLNLDLEHLLSVGQALQQCSRLRSLQLNLNKLTSLQGMLILCLICMSCVIKPTTAGNGNGLHLSMHLAASKAFKFGMPS